MQGEYGISKNIFLSRTHSLYNFRLHLTSLKRNCRISYYENFQSVILNLKSISRLYVTNHKYKKYYPNMNICKKRKTLKNLIGMNSRNAVCYKKHSAYHKEFLPNGSMQYTQYVCIVYSFLKLKKKKKMQSFFLKIAQNLSTVSYKGVSYTRAVLL